VHKLDWKFGVTNKIEKLLEALSISWIYLIFVCLVEKIPIRKGDKS
jgi:hypothetical protein